MINNAYLTVLFMVICLLLFTYTSSMYNYAASLFSQEFAILDARATAAAKATAPVIIGSYPTKDDSINATEKDPLKTIISPGKIFPKGRLSSRKGSGNRVKIPLEFVKTVSVPRTVATTVTGVVDGINNTYCAIYWCCVINYYT